MPNPETDFPPYGCARCGIPEHRHGQQYKEDVGWHPWVKPSNALMLRRMRSRLAARRTART